MFNAYLIAPNLYNMFELYKHLKRMLTLSAPPGRVLLIEFSVTTDNALVNHTHRQMSVIC